jgi:regulator of sigma E protease
MDILITIVSLLVALSILVFVHELGHLVAAKRSKIVVEEFGFGYPPRLWTFWRNEGKIVIGGREIVIPRTFELPEDLQAMVRVRYETTTDDKEREVLSRIEVVPTEDELAGSASVVELLDPGTIYSVNAIPFGGFAKMLGEEDPTFPGSFASKGKLPRIVVLAAGAGLNLVTAVIFFALAFALGAPAVADPENAMVASIAPGSPAEASGLQAGDVIVKADDTDILKMEDIQVYTQAHLGEPIVLTVERDGELLQIEVVPRPDPPSGEGPIGIGLSPRTEIRNFPWYEALLEGAKRTVELTVFIFSVPVQVIRGLIPADVVRPSGPVGIGQVVGETVQFSLDTGWWYPVMHIMGSLSVALAVTNLLPLPGLDGGRILFVIVEGIRGRRLDPAKEGLVHFIGLLILVILMLFITWQDIVHPIQPPDWSSFF